MNNLDDLLNAPKLPQPPKTKLITLPLYYFLETLWGPRESATPDLNISVIIASIDEDEQYTHVEFPDKENKLQLPKVWRIKDWRTSEELRVRQKKQSEERVILWNERTQLIDEITAGLITTLGLPEEMAKQKAVWLLEKGNEGFCKLMGVDIDGYLEKIRSKGK